MKNIAIIKFESEEDLIPVKARKSDTGYDLKSAKDMVIQAKSFGSVPTSVKVHLPEGYDCEVRGRSGLAFKKGIFAHLGTIDEEYRGDVSVCLFNMSDDVFVIKRGDRIAQLIITEVVPSQLIKLEKIDTTSSRGESGFGSTGK